LKEVPQECIWLGNSPVVTLGKGTRQDERNENVTLMDKFASVFHFLFFFFFSFSQTLSIHLRCINVSSGDATCNNGEDSVIFGLKFHW
jgi:hypothetical protein